MIAGAEQKEGHMGGSKSEKCNGTAIGCNDSSEKPRGKKKKIARMQNVDTKVGGVVLAKKNGIEGLNKQQSEYQAQNGERRENG